MKTEYWNGYQIRFVEKDGEWWAVAKDVSDALGYRDAYNMARNLKPIDKDTHKVSTQGGTQDMLVISEFGIYDATFNSHKQEAEDFKRWVYSMLKELRKSTGLEGFQVFRMLDKDYQKEAMKKLHDSLNKPTKISYIKANTITDKAVSMKYGYPKLIKKESMTPEMLMDREPILQDTVQLMIANDKFDLGLSVSKKIYEKVSG